MFFIPSPQYCRTKIRTELHRLLCIGAKVSTQSKRDVIRLLGTISKLRQKNLVGSKDTKEKVLALCLQCPAAALTFSSLYSFSPFP